VKEHSNALSPWKDAAPHDQGSHQNTLIIEPIGAFFVSTINNEIIHWTF